MRERANGGRASIAECAYQERCTAGSLPENAVRIEAADRVAD